MRHSCYADGEELVVMLMETQSGQRPDSKSIAGSETVKHQKNYRLSFWPFCSFQKGGKGQKLGRVSPSGRQGLNLPEGLLKGLRAFESSAEPSGNLSHALLSPSDSALQCIFSFARHRKPFKSDTK